MALMVGTTFLTPAIAAPSRASVSLTGAGSSFDFPLFSKAFEEYQKTHSGVTINYQPIGSGAGIQQFTAKTIDFGATDVPMDPSSELPAAVKAGGAVQQIPITLGGVAMSYNLPGIHTGVIHLTGPVIADIFGGLITKWNDKAIKKLNPKVNLPDMQITVVHRSDGSGTSYIFTDYLSKVSDFWRGKVGVGKLPNWPVGVGGKGNLGVATLVQQTPGALGYVELAYVLQNKMKMATIQNKSRVWLLPSLNTVAAAASNNKSVTPRQFSITNAGGKNSYPIAGYSWVLLYKNQTDSTKGKALVKLFNWMLTTGQKYASGLDYVPLPKPAVKLGQSYVKAIKA
jgi:phosphate transport system substrate-binding protein